MGGLGAVNCSKINIAVTEHPPALDLPMLTQAGRLEHEEKFILPAARSQAALGLLRLGLRPDPQYPRGIVHSVYFDTPDWKHLGEKVGGNFHKSKLRVRWYGSFAEDIPEGGSWVEVKVRLGSARSKLRLPVGPSAELLARTPLTDPMFQSLKSALGELGVPVSGNLRPVFEISYRRHRFVDPLDGDRISLDSGIKVTRVNSRVCHGFLGLTLPMAVIEIKGPGGRLPRVLRRDRRLNLRRSSFSKYELCHTAAMRPGLNN